MTDQNLCHIRHVAFQIVSQLPEETAEALLVLEYAKWLLMQPLDVQRPADQLASVQPLKLVRGDKGT